MDLNSILILTLKSPFKININKCLFIKIEVIVLGHLVNSAGIRPNPKKIKSIQQLPAPRDVTKAKGFLGVINFYRKFIPKCVSISEPLMQLKREK